MTNTIAFDRSPLAQRLWIYQSERFPVFKHGFAIVVFATAAAFLPAIGNESTAGPNIAAAFVASAVAFLAFLQLRIADEHKDYQDDMRFRPERPVPRGLVRLVELRRVAIASAIAQALLATALNPWLLAPLALTWAWMALMTVEFFAPETLKARPVLYLISHMFVTPFIALFALSCGWSAAASAPVIAPHTVGFLALAYANGVVIEVSRKSWALDNERPGVETYSKLWGPRSAAAVLIAAIAIGVGLLILALSASEALATLGAVAICFAGIGSIATLLYRAAPTPRRASFMEAGASVWVLASYALITVSPFVNIGVQS